MLYQFVQVAFAVLAFLAIAIVIRRSKAKSTKGKRKRATFVHLDLGLGGAERLVVDAACAVQDRGWKVNIITTNHPRDHCFPETLEQLQVTVHGHFLPHTIFGRFQVVCSVIRMCYLALKLALWTNVTELPEIIVCDGVSACIPLLKLVPFAKVLFYCHYPDQLLTRKKSALRNVYRFPIDLFEELSTGMSDTIVVNSGFTKEVFVKTFKRISIVPEIVYPCVNVKKFDQDLANLKKVQELIPLPSNKTLLLSINRFDSAKKIELAIESFALLSSKESLQLVIAGGYDPNVQHNIDYLNKLKVLAGKNNLSFEVLSKEQRLQKWSDKQVVFLPDITENQKIQLLKSALVLLYTPVGEHFGIVPCEAMLAQCPVIGTNTGGLLETVTTDEKRGFLRAFDAKEWAAALETLIKNPLLAKTMGADGRKRVISNFSEVRLADHLNEIMQNMLHGKSNKRD